MLNCSLQSDSKAVSGFILRIAFGFLILFVGLAHYADIGGYVQMVSGNLGPFTALGAIWAYILPGLLVVGGALFVLGMQLNIATWAAGIALGSIPAGMILKTLLGDAPLTDMMKMGNMSILYLLIYIFVVGQNHCCGGSKSSSSQ